MHKIGIGYEFLSTLTAEGAEFRGINSKRVIQ